MLLQKNSVSNDKDFTLGKNKIEVAVRSHFPGCDIRAILRSMKEEQKEHMFSNNTEAYIKYRKVVAEWMIDVCDYYHLHLTTTHAAIAYLDRLQPNEQFSRLEWQMLAISCILISSKYNESDENIPDIATLEEITQQHIPNESILNYELWALKRMGWKLNARTPIAFISSCVVVGILHPNDFSISFPCSRELEVTIAKECYNLSSFCILDTRFKRFLASDVAGAIIYWVRKSLGVTPIWRQELTQLTLSDPKKGDCPKVLILLNENFIINENNELVNEVQKSNNKETIFNFENDENAYPPVALGVKASPEKLYGALQSTIDVKTPLSDKDSEGTKPRTSPISISSLNDDIAAN